MLEGGGGGLAEDAAHQVVCDFWNVGSNAFTRRITNTYMVAFVRLLYLRHYVPIRVLFICVVQDL
jgi:hypothetical protein